MTAFLTYILLFSSNGGLASFEVVTIDVLVGILEVPVTDLSPLLDNDELDDDDNEEEVEDWPRPLLT